MFEFFVLPISHADPDNIQKSVLMAYGGFPVSISPISRPAVLINTAYAVGYSGTLKNALWAAYRLGNMKNEPTFQKWERPFTFYVDNRTIAKV